MSEKRVFFDIHRHLWCVLGNQNNLRSAAYEALMELIKNSPRDCYEVVKRTTVIILERLRTILQMESHIHTSSDRVQFNDLQSLLCATLQSVLKKVTTEDAPQISDPIMQSLLQMLHSSASDPNAQAAGGGGGVQEDAMLAISALIEKLGASFSKYMDVFKPILIQTLKNTAEYQVIVALRCCLNNIRVGNAYVTKSLSHTFLC